MADIYDTFRGKTLFFTGVTGFIGKVFLLKVLQEFPDVEHIYCLCRSKKGISMEERFHKGVLSSQCFFPLKKEIGEKEWRRRIAKITPIAGDITYDRLGISNADHELLTKSINLVVHLAATVEFMEKLNIAMNMNCLGTLRVLAFAQRCPHLEAFVHTSTCYVNYPRHGGTAVHERIYPLDFDPEAMVKFVMALHDEQIPGETDRLLKRYGFANTYTFSKNLTEHILVKRRGKTPMAIVRPSIVGAAWKEPYNGWVDALLAGGGFVLTAGLGITHDVIGNRYGIADMIPVDHVVNILLKAVHKTAQDHKASQSERIAKDPPSTTPLAKKEAVVAAATTGKGTSTSTMFAGLAASSQSTAGNAGCISDGALSGVQPSLCGVDQSVSIYQACTSGTMNPLRWDTLVESVLPWWEKLKHPKAVSKPYLRFYDSQTAFDVSFFLRQRMPLTVAKSFNRLPYFHSEDKEKLLARYEKALARTRALNAQFNPFVTKSWRFERPNADSLDNALHPKSRAAFGSDVFDINWYHYGIAYSWGMVRFVMKEDLAQPPVPRSGNEQVMRAFL